ncbi:MAG: threonine synthase [Spirochaetales bacterium]|nr:threonine synthase [Spirochaetales bacterium]
MKLSSTRDRARIVSYKEAIFQGLAPDGGLYLPVSYPDLSDLFSRLEGSASFLDVATELSRRLLGDELSGDDVEKLCRTAFPFSPRIVRSENHISILELFHGPTCAFKDFGASFLATSMELFLANESRRAVILTATSGDTGSAVAQAFKGKNLIDVVILYPSGRVSPLQEKQLTAAGGNVHALEVRGSFDDCQRMVKEAFVDPDVNTILPLTSANSINIGRLLPQAFYYVYGRSQYANEQPVRICVPSGNFGNLTAGIIAWKWGLKTEGFIAATNVNDVVPEYLKSSVYTARSSVHTYSNAMDVGDPSNFERILSIFDNDWSSMRKVIEGAAVTDTETVETIGSVWERTGKLLDPHTAVGYCAAKRYLAETEDKSEILVLATAHPAKFSEVVQKSIGSSPELPDRLAAYLDKKKVATMIGNTTGELKSFLIETLK